MHNDKEYSPEDIQEYLDQKKIVFKCLPDVAFQMLKGYRKPRKKRGTAKQGGRERISRPCLFKNVIDSAAL